MEPIFRLLYKNNLPHNEKTPRIKNVRLARKSIHDGVNPSNVNHKGFGYCDFVCERSFELVNVAAQYKRLLVRKKTLRICDRRQDKGHSEFHHGFTDQHFMKFKRLRVSSKYPVTQTPILEVNTGVMMKMQRNEDSHHSEILHSFDIGFTIPDDKSGQETQYIAIIKFSQVLGKMKLCKNGDGVWLEVELRYPPLLRRYHTIEPENQVRHGGGVSGTKSFHELSKELSRRAEYNTFDSKMGKGMVTPKRFWVRTGDPFSPPGLLGGYLTYCLELRSVEYAAPFLQIFHRNGLISSNSPHQPLVVLPPPSGAAPIGILNGNDGNYCQKQQQEDILTEHRSRREMWARHRACCSSKISFGVRYLLGCLVTNYVMDPASMDQNLEDFLIKVGDQHATRLLQTVIARHDPHDFIYKLVNTLQAWNSVLEKEKKKEGREVYSIMDSTAEVWVRRVVITPLRVCLMPPEIEGSSRAFRILNASNVPPDYLLRVTFSEETTRGFYPLNEQYASRRSNRILEQRVRQLMRGLRICDRVYKHLGSSNSQLRSHGAWFLYRQDPLIVHRLLGDFRCINVVARYAARVGQSFAASVSACNVPNDKCTIIPDIYTSDKKYCFSDGVGIMSSKLANKVAEKLGMSNPPSGIQFRFAGAKGMLSLMPPPETALKMLSNLDPECDMFIRNSQIKFESHCESLDVLNVARWMPAFLNRPLIQVLECRGIRMKALLDLMDNALHMVSTMLKNSHDALAALEEFSAIALNPDDIPTNDAHDLSYITGNLGFSGDDRACYEPLQVAKDMLRAGFDVNFDPYLQKTIRAFQRLILVQLRTKARILVPKAVNLFGVLDETGVLKEGEVYIGLDDPPITDKLVAVSRNPTMHPGDVRVLKSVKPQELLYLKNLIVFSQNGSRPDPDCMSGGDLDGDIFTVIWDDSLIPSSPYPPMLLPNTVRKNEKCAKVTLEDLQSFFVDYMKLDNLGRIAILHLVLADVAPGGPTTESCLKLCELASHAVDFAKTGVPANLETEFGFRSFEHPDAYPDFMERPDRPSYPSEKANGVLYRKVVAAQRDAREQRLSLATQELPADHRSPLDADLVFQGWEEFAEEAQLVHRCYTAEIKTLTRQFGIWDEAALVSAQVEFFTAQFIRREKVASVLPRLHRSLKLIRKQFRCWFADGLDLSNMGKSVPSEVFRKASAWYCVAYEGQNIDEVGFTLPWVIHDVLCLLKKGAIQERNLMRPPVISKQRPTTSIQQQPINHEEVSAPPPSTEGHDGTQIDGCGIKINSETNDDKEVDDVSSGMQNKELPFELFDANTNVWDSLDD